MCDYVSGFFAAEGNSMVSLMHIYVNKTSV